METSTPQQAGAAYANYGRLIHAWRNEIKHTIATVSEDTGISAERLKRLESGEAKPELEELKKLAKQFYVNVRDLLHVKLLRQLYGLQAQKGFEGGGAKA